jgi:hypothetical protein
MHELAPTHRHPLSVHSYRGFLRTFRSALHFSNLIHLYSLNRLTDVKEDAINMPQRLNFLSGRKSFINCLLLCRILSVNTADVHGQTILRCRNSVPTCCQCSLRIKAAPGPAQAKRHSHYEESSCSGVLGNYHNPVA